MPPSQPHPGGAAVLVNLRPTLIGCSTFFLQQPDTNSFRRIVTERNTCPFQSMDRSEGAGAERSFRYAPLEIVRKTLS